MNKKILNTLLVLTPQKIQHKAVAKALNFLFPNGFFNSDELVTVELYLSDLKRSWSFKMESSGFQPIKNKQLTADIFIATDLNTILESQDSRKIRNALNLKMIEINTKANDIFKIKNALSEIRQEKLDELVAYGYRFFKLTPKSRINIQTVTLEDIRIQKDVDFIRDEAVKLEKTDLNEALRLMEIAHQARPSGPFIAKKVIEYRAALDK